ncbi:hypothetical protein HYG81_01910 [Natrinema zhouii]|uniref:MYXO-CTERM domain-containing protein n=1 Tax=Natrinema zhouii TaxID=1710539 RepID=A0A7D6GX58_9EURY|nr:hypothetical protein [Natrinema zhouii]QLK27784.1 hypothetical protein HYG81_01910 [Natrinema zhouii]
MPEMEQQDKTLSEIIVKEAINKGMDSSMRESILEAVEESEGSQSGGRLPLAGALFGLGAAVGYLVGRQAPELEDSPIEDLEEPEIIEDVMEAAEETGETTSEMDDESEGSSTSRLPRLLLAVGVLAGAAFLRRRLASGEEEEWEPIEEFEPATGGDAEEEAESEAGEEAEAEAEETDEESEE